MTDRILENRLCNDTVSVLLGWREFCWYTNPQIGHVEMGNENTRDDHE